MPNIEISQLKVFLAAAEEESFSAAARRLHMSQSAVSQNIQNLEKTYGVELFIRRGRSVELSEAGETILPTAREVINAARLLEDNLQNVNNEVGGELIIGCSTSAGKYLMPTLLSSFQRRYPAVLPRVKIMGRDSVVERLLNETIPMGIASKRLDHRDLECVPLFEDRVILIVPPDHPWAKYGRALPSDLLDQPFITREESSGTCEVVMEGLKANSITLDSLNVIMELGNAEAIEMAVENGMGIAFVSEMVAARGLALGRIKKVNVEGLDLQRTVYIARNVNRPFTRAQNLFWEFSQSQYEYLNNNVWKSLVNFPPMSQVCEPPGYSTQA
ncbi:MAG: selenium metabolism-associated LysR family transcriptional regulator [Anaerolineales bacterium]